MGDEGSCAISPSCPRLSRLRGRSRFGAAKARASTSFPHLPPDVDRRDKPGHDEFRDKHHRFLPSTDVIASFDSSMPSMQLTLSATTSVPSGLLPRAKTSTPQSAQSWCLMTR